MYHHYQVPRKLVEIQAYCSSFEKRQMWLQSVFIEEPSVNLSDCGTLFNSKERNAFFFFFWFPFFFFLLAHNSIREENPIEGGKGESVTVELRSLTRWGPQQHL